MKAQDEKDKLNQLPDCAAEFIKQVIKKMRYRCKVRRDVQAELIAHFEDALKDCDTDKDRGERAEDLITEFGDVKLLAILLRRAKKRCRPLWQKIIAKTLQTVKVALLCLILGILIAFLIDTLRFRFLSEKALNLKVGDSKIEVKHVLGEPDAIFERGSGLLDGFVFGVWPVSPESWAYGDMFYWDNKWPFFLPLNFRFFSPDSDDIAIVFDDNGKVSSIRIP
jgi:hypothetical protein